MSQARGATQPDRRSNVSVTAPTRPTAGRGFWWAFCAGCLGPVLSAEPLGDSHAATPYDLAIQPHRIGLRDQCPRLLAIGMCVYSVCL